MKDAGMGILLIYPGIQGIGFDSFGRGSYSGHLQNLGVGYLSSYLKQQGYHVEFLDLRKMSGWGETARRISGSSCLTVGIQFNTVNFGPAIQCARLAREAGKVIVTGGPHASWEPQELINGGHADHVIIGEAEYSLADFLADPAAAPPIIEGRRCQNLDDLPFPDRHLDVGELGRINDPVTGRFPLCTFGFDMVASRGCPYSCRFCQPMQKLIFGKKIRYHSVEYVVEHIRRLVVDYTASYVHFVDDTFTLNKEWTLEFCDLMQKQPPGLRYWTSSSRADCVDREILKALRDAGCVRMNFGFESGSSRILKMLDKRLTPEQSIETARLCRELGILVIANFILGVPDETEDDMRKTLRLARLMKPDMINLSYFTPIPGSYLYNECKKRGLIENHDYSNFDRMNFGQIKGVDYAITTEYMRKIENCAIRWYESPAFSQLATDRWNRISSLGKQDKAYEEISFWSRPDISVMGIQYGRKVAQFLRRRLSTDDTRLAIYGADQSGVTVLNACLKSRIRIVAMYDRDPAKIGKIIAGVPVKFPEEIGTDSLNALLICSKGHENEIYRDLHYLEKDGVVMIRAAHEGLI
jgi:anaerobic magnesium-protoporphyrin IX monomethyl ester cyclase